MGARFPGLAAKVSKPLRIAGGFIFLGFIGVALGRNGEHFSHVGLAPIFALIILHNAMAIGLGYGAARLLKLTWYDARAVSIEVGIQNSGLGLVLVLNFFSGLGGMMVVVAGWGVWHIIAGLAVSKFWSSRTG